MDNAYKQVSPEWAEAFASGQSIKVGTFQHYAKMPGARADPHEGQQHHDSGPTPVHSSNEPAMWAMRQTGFIDRPARDMIVEGAHTVHYAPAYLIFCVATVPDFEGAEASGEWIFEIDMPNFLNEILVRYPDLAPARYATVNYNRTVGDLSKGEFFRLNMFAKPFSSRWENERRIIFTGRESLKEWEALEVPRIRKYVWPVHRPKKSSMKLL